MSTWSEPFRNGGKSLIRDVIIVLAITAMFVGVFLTVSPRSGIYGTSLGVVVPILAAGWLRGLWPGAATGLGMYLVLQVLYGMMSGGEIGLVSGPAGGVELPVLIAIGATVGRMRDLHARVTKESRRREALLRVTRRMAVETDARRVLDALVDEARSGVDADAAAIFQWNDGKAQLIRFSTTLAMADDLPDGLAASGELARAAREQAPAVIDDYPRYSDASSAVVRAGVRAAAAVPLVEKGQLLGVLWLGMTRPGRTLSVEDVELLELFAGSAAATLITLERSRLKGVLLAALTIEHEINNRLGLTVGYLDLLALDPAVPESHREQISEALAAALSAADIVKQLRRVIEIREINWSEDLSTIDLASSSPGPR
ncbi:MAG: GAF domain-containing protein [Chloroflexota bacterium]|nr:MAG: GAF domain-containing protein [Chloroflexota bacterium]